MNLSGLIPKEERMKMELVALKNDFVFIMVSELLQKTDEKKYSELLSQYQEKQEQIGAKYGD